MISDFFKKEHSEREKGRKEMRAANRLYAELRGRTPTEPAVAAWAAGDGEKVGVERVGEAWSG